MQLLNFRNCKYFAFLKFFAQLIGKRKELLKNSCSKKKGIILCNPNDEWKLPKYYNKIFSLVIL